jgi:hypothetical protein
MNAFFSHHSHRSRHEELTMKAEISHIGYAPTKNYSGVYQQQGRMLVDRDWNEFCNVMLSHLQVLGDQAIGTGSPRHGGLLTPTFGIRDEGGLVAAGGIIATVSRHAKSEQAVSLYYSQNQLPIGLRINDVKDGAEFYAVTVDKAILYADVWERTVIAIEDLDLLDPALHGADTCFRSQRMAQLKIARKEDLLTGDDPCNPQFQPRRIPTIGNAEFTIALVKAEELADNCDPCSADADIDSIIPNELFRLEIHRVEFDKERQPEKIWLKWSNENGSRELFATEARPTNFSYEFFSTDTELLVGMPSDDWQAPELLTGVLDPVKPEDTVKILPRIRQWDGWLMLLRDAEGWIFKSGTHVGVPLTDNSCKIKDGSMSLVIGNRKITLKLAERSFLAGDYWLAIGRSRAVGVDRYRALSELPIGIKHHYLVLGEAALKPEATTLTALTAHDRRRLQHPSLTCLDASDIGYDPKDCAYLAGTTTVQTALDKLCVREKEENQHGKIIDVSWKAAGKFENDALVKRDVLKGALVISFDQEILEPQSISSDILVLTAEPPARSAEDQPSIFRSVIICGHVEAGGKSIYFLPNDRAIDQALAQFNWGDAAECKPKEGVRFRIKLMGRFFRSAENKLPFDCYVPGFPNGDRIELLIGKEGIGYPSDFEAWFYVDPTLKRIRFDEAVVADLEAIDIPRERAQIIFEQLRIAPNLEALAVAVDLTPNERLRIQEKFQR